MPGSAPSPTRVSATKRTQAKRSQTASPKGAQRGRAERSRIARLSTGNEITFDPTTGELSAPADNTETVVVTIGGSEISVPPGETVSAVVIDITPALQDIVDDNPGTPVADKVEDAIPLVQKALDELAKEPPDAQAAMGAIESAVGDLGAALGLGSESDDENIMALIDQLALAARQLAEAAIAFAISESGDADEIAEAIQFLEDGDQLLQKKDAVNKYKNSLAKAESAVG